MRLPGFCRILNEMFALPEVTIRMSGDGLARHIFRIYTARHPKYKIIQNKRWGVALLPLPARFADYLKENELLRRRRRRSVELGFHFDRLDPSSRLEDVLAINSSLRSRQGGLMDSSLLSIDELKVWARSKPVIYGVFDSDDVLRAYTHAPITGEVFTFSRLLAHGEDLDKGIMYFMVSEVIREMIERRDKEGAPVWAMYDTFFGAPPGLRFFKERLGFKPYKVRWVWEEEQHKRSA